MKRRHALLAAAATPLTLLSRPAHAQAADAALERIGAQIARHPVIRARFVQTKRIADLKRPLVTTGSLVFSRQHGVMWTIEQPYRMTYLLGEQAVVEIGRDGQRVQRDMPGLAQVSRIFQAVLGTQVATLREYFDVSVESAGAKWALLLRARGQLAQFMSGLRIEGTQFVDSLRIDEASGDSTLMVFSDTRGDEALTPAERALFTPEATRR